LISKVARKGKKGKGSRARKVPRRRPRISHPATRKGTAGGRGKGGFRLSSREKKGLRSGKGGIKMVLVCRTKKEGGGKVPCLHPPKKAIPARQPSSKGKKKK